MRRIVGGAFGSLDGVMPVPGEPVSCGGAVEAGVFDQVESAREDERRRRMKAETR